LPGTLYVIATPIGNLEDITLRALRVLGEVGVIAAEDTRAARHLLEHHRIEVPSLVSFFAGNEAERAAELCERLVAGEDVAVISEAGTPGISDPGERLVRRAVEAGVPVVAIPGASAALTALVSSGLPAQPFLFIGFPPRDEGPRQESFARLRAVVATLIFYEAPGRTHATLLDLAAALGDRPAVVARELTKLHEELARGPLSELAARYAVDAPRGEVTIVVAPPVGEASAVDAEAEVRRRLALGESPKEIAAAVALLTGQPRRKIYQLAIALRPLGR
jgi:16S rRNA (cytidine1402-2'-O)-methyltransferase